MLSLIKSLIIGASAYFELRNKAFYYDKMRESRERRKDLIDEIEILRSKRTNDATDRADLLLIELRTENDLVEHLSSLFFKLEERDDS